MSINIINARLSENEFPNGTTAATIFFDAYALEENVNIIVEFQISPFPEMSFGNGLQKVTGSFIVGKNAVTYKKNVTIKNGFPDRPDWENSGLLVLVAKEYNTGNESYSSANFNFN